MPPLILICFDIEYIVYVHVGKVENVRVVLAKQSAVAICSERSVSEHSFPFILHDLIVDPDTECRGIRACWEPVIRTSKIRTCSEMRTSDAADFRKSNISTFS